MSTEGVVQQTTAAPAGGGTESATTKYDGPAALEFLHRAWSTLIPDRVSPIGTTAPFDDLRQPAQLPHLIRVFHELIQAFLRGRQSEVLDLSEEVVNQNPSMALQTSIISLEDALGVDISYIQVNKISEGNKKEILNLCQTLQTCFSTAGPSEAELAAAASAKAQEAQPKGVLKKSASSSATVAAGAGSTTVAPRESEFRAFSLTGINRTNPFQSKKASIYGLTSSPFRPKQRDAFLEREAARRRDREDELYFNERYDETSPNKRRGGDPDAPDEESKREDEDYAFLRQRSQLPLHKLSRGQAATARELSEERKEQAPSNPFTPYREAPGTGVKAIQSAGRASDEDLLETIAYLEQFLERAREKARLQAKTDSPWKAKLKRMGGAEAVGREAAYQDDVPTTGEPDYLGARRSARPRSAPSRRGGYLQPTVGSDPWGAPTPDTESKFERFDEEYELARLEAKLFSLRRQAVGLSPQQTKRQRERQVDLALENIRDRDEIEKSISLLKDYTKGRPIPREESREERQARSYAAKLFSPEPEHTAAYRIPSTHPHRTGKNHHPATCVYCKRELDWNSWNTKTLNLLDDNFPNRQPTWREPFDASSPIKVETSGVSRLRPLAANMLKTSRDLIDAKHNISRDFSGHFLSQLSAAERRRASNRLDSLWTIVSNTERDKKIDLHKVEKEIAEEAWRRSVHMRLLEEQAMERALKKTMVDKASEREVQKLLQEEAKHVAQLLELKRTSLANYTRDQCDLLTERHRIERETQKLRAQNEKHSAREMQRELKELQQRMKQTKLNQLQHAEEKFSFKLSQLERSPYSKNGIEDLRFWKTGRD